MERESDRKDKASRSTRKEKKEGITGGERGRYEDGLNMRDRKWREGRVEVKVT